MVDDSFPGPEPPEDKTIMQALRPGGRATQTGDSPLLAAGTKAPVSGGLSALPKAPPVLIAGLSDRNVILGITSPLLCYAAELRHVPQPSNDSQIYSTMVDDIKHITQSLRGHGLNDNVLATMRYMLCTFIDEMILNTPWGANSAWANQPLLSFFHKEARGGVKFFDILRKLTDQPGNYIDLLEFAFVCLSLGYMGQYRMQPNSAASISQLQDNIYQIIRQTRNEELPTLSPPIIPAVKISRLLTEPRTVWLTSAICLAVLGITFTSLLFKLYDKSDPITVRASTIGVNMPQLVKKPRNEQLLLDQSTWGMLLAQDLAQGTIDVQRTVDGIVFILFGNGLFDSGSAELTNRPLITRVIEAIKTLPSKSILITGHSDNVPIRTIAFPSNLTLSQARAQTIATQILRALPDKQIEVEGMADLNPIVTNDNAINRAKNRRVEITVFMN